MENNQKAFNLPFSQNLPIILIGNLSVEPLRAAGIIEEALTQVKDKLTEFIASPTLATDLQTVFGQSTDIPWARTLLDALPVSDELPQITLVSADLMNGAVGGFDSLTGTVYLADSLIDPNTVITSDTQPSPHLVNVIIEELGHWLDSQLNQVDTPGDEGELLAALVQGDGLSQEDIGRLKNEDDRGLICVEGKPVAVEMSGLSITGSDGVAPELVGVSLTARSVDASSSQGSMGVKLQVSDNSSGFNYGSVSFSSPSGQNSFGLYLRDDPSYLVSGTELAGTYSIKELLPEGAEAGTWTFSSLSLSDDAGNYGYYDGNALQLLGINPNSLSFTVTNVNSDAVAPELVGVSLTATSVDASSGQGSMGVELQVSDNSSGFSSGSVSFSSPSGQNSFELYLPDDPSYLVSGTELAGTYSINDLLPQGAEAGTWTFSSLYLDDDAGNSRNYDGNALQLLGINPNSLSFTVTNVNSDAVAPELVGVNLTATSVDASSGQGSMGVELQVSDNSSGFNYGFVSFSSPSGQNDFDLYLQDDPSYLVSGTELAGTYSINDLLPEGAEAGTWTFSSLYLSDDAGNTSYYFDGNALQLLGINPNSLSFTVNYTTPTSAKISIKDTQIIEGDNGKKLAKFTVSLNTPSTQTVTLQKLSKDADINLYGSEQELMTQGINDGTNPEIIEYQLDPGIYYVKVYPKVKTYTNYRLNVDFS
ncbi:DUF7035 domain-containing protein [Planktothrix agardhii]|uniref:DUF7035 domain-containing protein n=1 Tax=Planktothrix agardhii TaxID=1160 RepID=UPI001D0B0959|nr:hypothetical protein [Planktothrix agardhii]MCB8760260.1 hypothetical protein [Planktothrix agardhii 1813]